MKKMISALLSCAILLPLMAACEGSTPSSTTEGNTESPVVTTTPITTVEEPSSQTLVIHTIGELNTTEYPLDSAAGSEQFSSLMQDFRASKTLNGELNGIAAYYPRVKKISDDTYVMIFHNTTYGGSVYCSMSTDCYNWGSPRAVFRQSTVKVNGVTDNLKYMTPDACVLSDGRLLCVTSFRAEHAYQTAIDYNGVAVSYSSDNGKTWTEPETVYVGTNWEPMVMQADNGEIYIFFTCTAPSIYLSDFDHRSSGVGMIRSTDGGKTWSPNVTGAPYIPQYVMRQYVTTVDGVKKYTDQMPVALQLNNGTIALAAESQLTNGYKFSICYTDDYFATDVGMEKTGPVGRKTNLFNAAGPYLAQFDSGEVILTYHWTKTFRYRLANCTATTFFDEKTLFSESGMWGSVEKLTSHSAVIVAPTKEDYKIQLARVYLNHTLNAQKMTPSLTANTAEWDGNTDALFAGENSQAQVAVRVAHDEKNVYLLAEVSDRYLTDADKFIFYCHDGKEGQYAVTLSVAEVITEYRASITEKASEVDASSLGIRTHVAFDGTVGDVTDIDNGYIYEVAIPKTLLGVEDMLAFRFRLISRDSANGKTVQEDPYPSAGLKDTSGWAKAKLVP
ncbi:MAG: hypothetical protein ACI4WZ_01100 [Eubacteriales bacterium]